MALEKPGKLREFFSATLWPPCCISSSVICLSISVKKLKEKALGTKFTFDTFNSTVQIFIVIHVNLPCVQH